MPIATKQVRSYPKKLRKSLTRLRQELSAERVHQLRTRTRRMEAMIHALELDSRKNERRLLKAIKPVRKKAGKVRDMDVFSDFASQPQHDGETECFNRLLEYLRNQRQRYGRKLKEVAANRSPQIRKGLKRCGKYLDRALHAGNDKGKKWSVEAAALALQLQGELRDWPALNRRNLHPFRLKVKELRYVLQMAVASDREFVVVLGEVKDAAGEWHDWEELAGIAAQVIQHRGCDLLKQIRSTAERKFQHALTLANRMRKQDLARSSRRQRTGAAGKANSSVPLALKSASALAA